MTTARFNYMKLGDIGYYNGSHRRIPRWQPLTVRGFTPKCVVVADEHGNSFYFSKGNFRPGHPNEDADDEGMDFSNMLGNH